MVKQIELGRFRLYCLCDGYFKLDGGAIFGVVPKVLWSKVYTADDRNRIQLGLRLLLIEANGKWILIDTGIGDKFDETYRDIFGIQRVRGFEDDLRDLGLSPADIQIVINTHLHWDHAGGNTKRGANQEWIPNFPNARYIVQRGEYDSATHLNERTRGSYRMEDYKVIEEAGSFHFIDGDTTISEGVRVVRSGGHVPYHQCVLLESGKNKAFFLGDLIPTHAHLPFPYITGFDLEPLVTLERKKQFLAQAIQEGWLLFFSHDPDIANGKVDFVNGSYRLSSQAKV